MATLTNGIEVARKLFDQEAFGEMVDKEVFPGRDNKEVCIIRTVCMYLSGWAHLATQIVLWLCCSSCGLLFGGSST